MSAATLKLNLNVTSESAQVEELHVGIEGLGKSSVEKREGKL